MKREILFRGKRYSNGEWVYGNLYIHTHNGLTYPMILQCKFSHVVESEFPLSFTVDEVFLVIPETVGQFTGLSSKNGVNIFEGDVLKSDLQSKGHFVVTFEHGSFCTYWTSDFGPTTPMAWTFVEGFTEPLQYFTKYGCVVGNMHDNPQLIGKEVSNVG